MTECGEQCEGCEFRYKYLITEGEDTKIAEEPPGQTSKIKTVAAVGTLHRVAGEDLIIVVDIVGKAGKCEILWDDGEPPQEICDVCFTCNDVIVQCSVRTDDEDLSFDLVLTELLGDNVGQSTDPYSWDTLATTVGANGSSVPSKRHPWPWGSGDFIYVLNWTPPTNPLRPDRYHISCGYGWHLQYKISSSNLDEDYWIDVWVACDICADITP
jgi:hypothetical protein